MKKIFLICALAAATLTASAQYAESYFNLSPKIGYANMLDNLSDPTISNKRLFGGGGAGLGLLYELQYVTNDVKNYRFLFNIGADFDWMHSTNFYNFGLERPASNGMTYRYRFLDFAEGRDVATIGAPISIGGQLGNFYMLFGAKVGYNLFGNYRMFGNYQVTAFDPIVGAEIGTNPEAGTGSFSIDKGAEGFRDNLKFAVPEVRALAEIGLDLDPWLQAPKPKKAPKAKKGAKREPFTVNDLHYRIGLFAEYGVLNSNAMPSQTEAIAFADNTKTAPSAAASLLTTDGSKLNNLLVGVKFTMQFKVPAKKLGKTPTGGTVSQSSTLVRVYNKKTGRLIVSPDTTRIIVRNDTTLRAQKPKPMPKGEALFRFNRGSYSLFVACEDFYSDTITKLQEQSGVKDTLDIYLEPVPHATICLSDAETGAPIERANIRINTTTRGIYRTSFMAVPGNPGCYTSRRPLDPKGSNYELVVTKPGYESYTTKMGTIGDSIVGTMNPVKVGKKFVLKNMFFATNSTTILPDSDPELQNLLEFMKDDDNRRIRIIGHTDSQGKEDANQRLSEGRANAVRNALIQLGIDGSRIEAEGKGESQPIDTNDTPEGRQNNRRVEVEILQ